MSEYNLCSLLVHCQANKVEQVQRALERQPGTEIHASTKDCRLIVTLEADNRQVIAQQILDIQIIRGVLSAAMIYQFSDEQFDDENINHELFTDDIKSSNTNEPKSAPKRMNA